MSDFINQRVLVLEEEVEILRTDLERGAKEREDLVTAIAAMYEMLRRVEYDMRGERFDLISLGTYSVHFVSDDTQKLPLKLSIVKLKNNEIRIDFLSDGDDGKHN